MAWKLSINRKGCTRVVVLTANYAIKFPTLYSWQHFLHGLLANCKEKLWTSSVFRKSEPMLPPVVWVCPGGWFSIQRRVRPVRHRGLFYVELQSELFRSRLANEFWLADLKPENFGYFGSQLVKIDLN